MIASNYFTYDGVFSGTYGLQIVEFDPDNVQENEAFSPTLTTMKVPKLLRFYHGGVEYDSAPTCEFKVISQDNIPPELRSEILSWLVGRNEFKPLKFHNNDWEDFVYYCVFTGSRTIYINGECHGFVLTASFDSPFARGIRTTAILLASQCDGTPHDLTIENRSDIRDGYTYPLITFKGNTSIINLTDDSTRVFGFTGVATTEQIQVDCETKTITSTVSGPVLDKFTSKNWVRLRPGMNTLRITCSGLGPVSIVCPYYAMIGY